MTNHHPVPAAAALLLGAALVGDPQGVVAMPASLVGDPQGVVAMPAALSPVFAERPSPAALPAASCEAELLPCSCFTHPDPAVQHAEWVERAELVVRVTVLEVDPLASPSPPPPAGLPSLQDPRFARLLYARWTERLEAWTTTVCAGTTRLETARARGDLARLGPGTPAA